MKILRAGAALWLAAHFLTPDIARAANAWRTQDPCGMIFCCCPTMCKQARKGRLACRLPGKHDCGIRSSSERASWSPLSSGDLLSELPSDTLLRKDVLTFDWVPRTVQARPPAVRVPLDKPPAVFS